jgi:UDP-N-acetylmuramoyl-tripeptide--D-alanyl-D-alanine ligase
MKKIFKFIIERYLKILTKIIISRHDPIIVAIAGSSNKTFIKDQILEKFNDEKSVRGNPRSFNTEIGLPLAVLFLPSGYSSIFKWVDILLAGTYISFFKRNFPKILVLEMGVQKKGDIKYLLSIVKPRLVVISDISGNFSDNKKIIDEEMARLISSVNKNGRVVLNMDNERVAKLSKYSKAPVIFYGVNKEADVKIMNFKETAEGQLFDLEIEKKIKSQKTELFGMHNVYALVAAQTVSNEIEKFIKNRK